MAKGLTVPVTSYGPVYSVARPVAWHFLGDDTAGSTVGDRLPSLAAPEWSRCGSRCVESRSKGSPRYARWVWAGHSTPAEQAGDRSWSPSFGETIRDMLGAVSCKDAKTLRQAWGRPADRCGAGMGKKNDQMVCSDPQ